MAHIPQIEALLKAGGLLSSVELARRSGLSQPTVSRTLRGMSNAIHVGGGRGSRFALLHAIGNHGHAWPLFRITENGEREDLGMLTAIEGDYWLVRFASEPDPLLSRGLKSGLSEGWPWFLDGLRPQGFMGRAFARQHCRILGISPDLNRWGSDEFLLSSLLFGGDLPGNLMVGEHPVERPETMAESHWPELAREAIRGNPPGSSAGGEQPKFSSGTEIVKFAQFGGDGERWVDLLVAENLAGEVLSNNGIAVACSRIVEQEGFRFLAVQRFDRTENGGRRGLHSLEALDGAFIGEGSGAWPELAGRLYHPEGLIGQESLDAIQLIWDFGRAIGNTDMHPGNLSFLETENRLLTVAPVYDMLPMAYSPNAAGMPGTGGVELRPSTIHQVIEMARDFWNRVADDRRISRSFREIAQSNQRAYQRT